MALNCGVATAFVFVLALASIELSSCYSLKGSVACLDCDVHYDLSGMTVMVKCDHVKKLGIATTLENGSFHVEIPSDSTPTPDPSNNCVAKILGGPYQVYSSTTTMVSKIAKSHQSSSHYTVSQPLSFYTCTLPREWGLAPPIYYVPFMPIIVIP